MIKKKWALLILLILVGAGYLKFFYKTYRESVVAKSADCIIALDVKRITNTVIWNIITTPSEWKRPSFSTTEKISWRDMVKVPDYLFVFHSVDQPLNAWYAVLEIKDKKDFDKGLLFYGFEKGSSRDSMQHYFSKKPGVEIIRYGDHILVGNEAVQNKNYIQQIANELFLQREYTPRNLINKNVKAKSHFSLQIFKNKFLQEAAVFRASFDKNKIVLDASITPGKRFSFTERNFSHFPKSLCGFGFTQPSEAVYDLIPAHAKSKISKALNFDIDSLFLQMNYDYSLDISAIHGRTDSAISYSYDDNFNPIEKVVVNNVSEPSFNFGIRGEGVESVYNYWRRSGKLEKTLDGDLFVPIPFVKSHCKIKNKNELHVVSNNYREKVMGDSIHCIFFLNIMFNKIPTALQKYCPASVIKVIANMESVQIIAQKKQDKVIVQGRFYKKKNDFQIINW